MDRKRIRAVVAHGKTADDVANQLKASGVSPQFTIIFADAKADQTELAAKIHDSVGGTTWGMSSAGEITHTTGDIATGTIAVMALEAPQQTISFGTGIAGINGKPEQAGEDATRQAFESLHFKPEYLYLGLLRKSSLEMVAATPYTLLIAHDGHTFAEEATIKGIANVVGRGARVVGGSAADHLDRFNEPRVYLNGKSVKDAIAVAAVGTSLKNGTGMANAFRPVLGKGAFVTESVGRVVKTLNGRPAAHVYAELVGAKSLETLGQYFQRSPLGLLDATSGYWQVRSPASANAADGSMQFFSAMPPGIGVTLLEADAQSRVDSVKLAVQRAWQDAGRPKKVAALVLFNCILCHLHSTTLKCSAAEVNATQEVLKELTGQAEPVPTIGFSTFGETGATTTGTLGHHNQTLTAWLLADELVHQSA